MSSSGKILPKIKTLLEETSEDGLDKLFFPVLTDINNFADRPAEELLVREDKKEIIDLFANPNKPSLRELYGRQYSSFMLFYSSLHQSDLANLNARQKREANSFSEEFPTLLAELISELDAMLKVDESTEHQVHYRALREYLTTFTTLIQAEEKIQADQLHRMKEKKWDDELRKTSGGPTAS